MTTLSTKYSLKIRIERRTPPTAQTSNSHKTTTNCQVTNVLNQTIPAMVETMTAALTHFTTVMTS